MTWMISNGVVKKEANERRTSADEANKIVAIEVQGFCRRLLAERVIRTIIAMRQRLDELCQQELEFLRSLGRSLGTRIGC